VQYFHGFVIVWVTHRHGHSVVDRARLEQCLLHQNHSTVCEVPRYRAAITERSLGSPRHTLVFQSVWSSVRFDLRYIFTYLAAHDFNQKSSNFIPIDRSYDQ